MPEYIERDALLKKALEGKRFVFRMEDLIRQEVVFQTVYKDFGEFVLSIPAADVVAVVRCKGCKHFLETKGIDSGKPCGYGLCKLPTGIRGLVSADDFCSCGERRGEDGT